MQKQIDSVVANFPKPKGNIKMNEPSAEPNPLAIIKFTKHLQSCAISIPNSNDDLGYLGAIVSDDIYQKCNANGTSYTAPNDPGRAPVYSAPEPTEATGPATRSGGTEEAATQPSPSIITNSLLMHQTAMKQHEGDKAEWTAYKAALTALRNLITDNIDDMYIASFSNDITGFTSVTPKALLKHINATYATVTEGDLDHNENLMKQPWDHTQSIEMLFNKIEDCVLYAEAGGEPISDKRTIRYTFLAIKNTGLFNLSCDQWNEKNEDLKTWSTFKTFFTAEKKKIKNHTTGELGIAQEEKANALIDLTSTLINCKTEIASLKEEINTNRPPLADITSSVNAAQGFTQQQLDQAVAAALAQKKASNTNRTPVSQPPQSATRDTRIQGYNDKGYPISYCWSCGITGNLNHSSGTCNTPRDGHRKEATFKTKMGGTEKKIVWNKKSKKKTDE